MLYQFATYSTQPNISITMKLKDLRQKLKAFSVRSFFKGNDDNNVRGLKNGKKLPWMMPISHGYYVVEVAVEDRSWRTEGSEIGLEQPDSVVVQREEMGNLELWFYGVSNAVIADSICRYLQSNLFDKNLNEFVVSRKAKETIRKGYLNARAKLDKSEKIANVGSASAMVINGEKLVIVQMGGYRAIVCRDGVAHHLRTTKRYTGRGYWPQRLIAGAMRVPREHMQACHFGIEPTRKQENSSELLAATERIDSKTEFIILASNGIFEVMRNQEAVDLIRHIDDPKEAAQCLAREALNRMSRSRISCLVIRFD